MAAKGARETFYKLLLVAMLSLTCCLRAPAWAAAHAAASPADEYPYYVEFRAAVDGLYGHSYIGYGRLSALGRPTSVAYADIHPIGGFVSMVLGHFRPMAASTNPEKETLGHQLASRFRQPLTTAEYGRLMSVIAGIRATHHSWSALAYNCNDFVADVARGIGMQAPTTLSLPYAFIPTLQVLNEQILRPIAALRDVTASLTAR